MESVKRDELAPAAPNDVTPTPTNSLIIDQLRLCLLTDQYGGQSSNWNMPLAQMKAYCRR